MIKKILILALISMAMEISLFAEETNAEIRKNNLLLEGGNEAILATRNNFYIDYSDEVTGGCLPKPARLKDKLELSLRRNHLNMSVKKDILNSTLKLNALGFKAGPNYCAVTLTLTLESWIAVKVPFAENNPDGDMTLVPMQFIIGQYLLTGKKGSMQRRLEKVAYELGDNLYLKIARSRDVIFEKFPAIASDYKEKNKK